MAMQENVRIEFKVRIIRLNRIIMAWFNAQITMARLFYCLPGHGGRKSNYSIFPGSS
jgi:hypothetical protein